MTYLNDRGQLDTYIRALPKTDDPAECMEYLLAWWRSKRECEEAIYEAAEPPHGTTTGPMLMAEDDAIEALLDALAGTEKVSKPAPEVCAASSDLLAVAKAYEKWEADLITHERAWRNPPDGEPLSLPYFNGDLLD